MIRCKTEVTKNIEIGNHSDAKIASAKKYHKTRAKIPFILYENYIVYNIILKKYWSLLFFSK